MKSIDDIIRDECLPMRDCMLTVQDINGEAGFLYFKDTELIEANYAALWGKEALSEVLTWNLAEYAVAPLPLGIKRSLWDSLESLLNPKLEPTASGRIPILKARYSKATEAEDEDASAFDPYRKIPGIIKLVRLVDNEHQVLFEAPGTTREQTEWTNEFMQKARAAGETLGFGQMNKWILMTDRYQMIAFKHEKGVLVIMRTSEAGGLDDFETACQDCARRK
jgi:hypothetical protein